MNEKADSEKCKICANWFPCKVCDKNVNKNHRAFKCDNTTCNQWIHIKCNLLSTKDYTNLQNSNDPFFCINCLKQNIPFTNLSDNEFNIYITKGINTNLTDDNLNFLSVDQQKFLKNINDTLNRTTGDEIDDDDNDQQINCNYYDINEFSKAKIDFQKSFSIFHLNIHSIQLHFEELKLILDMLDSKFDIIALTESKIQKHMEPIIDITLEGYHKPVGTPTEATKGGVLLYISKELNFKPRNDLNIYETKKLESIFVEIICPNKSNSIIGSIYRHPSMPGFYR